MPDSNSKITTFDDLVKDLIESKTPAPAQGQGRSVGPLPPLAFGNLPVSKHRPEQPPSPTPLPQTNLHPLTSRGVPPEARSVTLPPLSPLPKKQTLERPKIQEYQSTIRTLSGDLERIKTGQKLNGTDIERRILNIEKLPVPPKITPDSLSNVPLPPKPSERGITEPKLPEKEAPPVQKGNLLGNMISWGSAHKMILSIAMVVVIAMGGVGYYFLYLYAPEPTPGPTISQSPVPTTIKRLNDILGSMADITVNFPKTGNPGDLLSAAIQGQNVDKRQFKKITAVEMDSGQRYSVLGLFDRFFINYPANFKEALGAESAVLLYGQEETFGSDGKPTTIGPAGKKLIILSEIKDQTKAASALLSWEPTMVEGMGNLLNLDPKSASSPNFMNNTYREVNIRYRNFQFPDKTIDYAMMAANNQKIYLVISNSKEAIYEIIDKLK